MSRVTRLLLVLLSLRQKARGWQWGIVDYHRTLVDLGHPIHYLNCRLALQKLARDGILDTRLLKVWVRNSLVDPDGTVKLERDTQVYKRVYSFNPESQEGKRILNWLSSLATRLFQKDVLSVASDDHLFRKLCFKITTG